MPGTVEVQIDRVCDPLDRVIAGQAIVCDVSCVLNCESFCLSMQPHTSQAVRGVTISGVAEAAWRARGVSKRRDWTVGVQTSDLNSCGMNSLCTTLYVIPLYHLVKACFYRVFSTLMYLCTASVNNVEIAHSVVTYPGHVNISVCLPRF
jgi:hypothetical protein